MRYLHPLNNISSSISTYALVLSVGNTQPRCGVSALCLAERDGCHGRGKGWACCASVGYERVCYRCHSWGKFRRQCDRHCFAILYCQDEFSAGGCPCRALARRRQESWRKRQVCMCMGVMLGLRDCCYVLLKFVGVLWVL